MITSGSEEVDVSVRSFKATTRTARKAGAAFFYISATTATHVEDALDHYSGTLAQLRQNQTDPLHVDALGRQWVRDNPGKARAELAKVEASR